MELESDVMSLLTIRSYPLLLRDVASLTTRVQLSDRRCPIFLGQAISMAAYAMEVGHKVHMEVPPFAYQVNLRGLLATVG